MNKREIPEIGGIGYIPVAQIGSGGTAEVISVRSSGDGKLYALKRIEKNKGSKVRDMRFRNEIKFGMEAENDHVIRIHAQAEDETFFYYVMDLYPKTLRDVISGEVDYVLLLDYLAQLCEAVAYVHGSGIVHRDIKPENILIDDVRRNLALADFGIAHFKDSVLTKRNELLANRNYQAPEQMARKDPGDIREPADIFALGLIFTETFTKQNSRGTEHRRVRDVYPFLAELDLLVQRMLLQDETQRIGIEAVRDSILLIGRQVASRIKSIRQKLDSSDATSGRRSLETRHVLDQASEDILSAKHIFERATVEELSRYNLNYHAEISYRVKDDLYNACVHSELYSMCRAKFEYEGGGAWEESNLNSVMSPHKSQLVREFESIQNQYPLAEGSIWNSLPRIAAHYFRFSRDYHCEELLGAIRGMLADPPPSGSRSLRSNLVNSPILWIVSSVRKYLATDRFEMTPANLQLIKFERQVGIEWKGGSIDDSFRRDVGLDLFHQPLDSDPLADVLEAFKRDWNVSVAERVEGDWAIHFRSRAEYVRFRQRARALAQGHPVFQVDVQGLLRTQAAYDDLVALIWEPIFQIPNTLAKILELREIT